ncbi:MAG: DUF5947 family protein [Bryobacteraceae bacterium]
MSVVMAEAQYGSFNVLRSLVRQPDPRERCELCGAGLHPEHQHLFEPVARKLVCSCDGCAVLFHSHGETRYKRVPRRIRGLRDFQFSDAQWDDLMIPIGMAFFLNSSVEGRVLAFYPSPAGATESMPSLTAWEEIVKQNPVLDGMEPDVEALLANRLEHARAAESGEYFLVPIDKCYELVGLIRRGWCGFSGGTEVWKQIGSFFDTLNARASRERAHA